MTAPAAQGETFPKWLNESVLPLEGPRNGSCGA